MVTGTQWLRRQSIEFKVIAPLLLIVVALCLVASTTVYFYLEGQTREAIRKHARQLAGAVVYSASVVPNLGELQRVVHSLGAEQDVLRIVVENAVSGRIVIATHNALIGELHTGLAEPHEKPSHTHKQTDSVPGNQSFFSGQTRLEWHDDRHQFELGLSIYFPSHLHAGLQSQHAVVVVTLDTAPTLTKLRTDTVYIGIALLLALCALYFITYALFRRVVVAPVTQLITCITNGHEHQLNRQLDGYANDEIGQLAETMARAFKEKHNNHRRYRDVFETTTDAIVTCDETGEIESFNPAAERIFGQQQADVLSKNLEQLIPGILAIATITPRQSHSGRESQSTTILHGVCCGCNAISLEIMALHTRMDSRNLRVFLMRDVTDKVDEDEQIRESEAKYRTLFEHSRVGVAMVDVEGNFLEVNSALEEMLGYSREELLQMKNRDCTHPDDIASMWDYMRPILHGSENTKVVSKRYLKKDGSTVWAEMHLSAIRNTHGDVEKLIGAIHDLSHIVAATQAIKDSEQRFKDFANASGEWFWEMDAELRFNYISDQNKLITGVDREQIIGRTRAELSADITPELTAHIINPAIKNI